MLLALHAAVALAANGYHQFTVAHDHPFTVTLRKSMLVLALDEVPPDAVNFSVVDRRNRTLMVPIAAFSHLILFETSLSITVPARSRLRYLIHFWLIPRHLCSSVSYSGIVDHRVTFQLRSDSVHSDFCLFSQAGASSYSAAIDFQSSLAATRVEFYTNSKSADRVCKRPSLCRFSARRPFFVRVANATNAEFEAVVSLAARRGGVDSHECSVKPIPVLVEPPIQVPMGRLTITDVKCVSQAENTLRTVVFDIAVGLVALALLALLHWSGVINLRVLWKCSGESERFGALKENPYADPLPNIVIDEKQADEL
jgi:hypothetical protein